MDVPNFYIRSESALKRSSMLIFLPGESNAEPAFRGAFESFDGRYCVVYRDVRQGPEHDRVLFTLTTQGLKFSDVVASGDGSVLGVVESKVLRFLRTKWLVNQGPRTFVGRERSVLVALVRDALPWLLSSTFVVRDEVGRTVARCVLERGIRPGMRVFISGDSLDFRLVLALAARMTYLED